MVLFLLSRKCTFRNKLSTAQCDSVLDHILDFIEEHCEAEMTEIIREIR